MHISVQLTKARLKALGNIASQLAQIFFAGLVIAPLLEKNLNYLFEIVGLLLALNLWAVKLYIVTIIQEE